MIPKIIHYCWFGKKQKPIEIVNCIKSWRLLLPEYEIIEWNESNTDLNHPFLSYFVSKKKWAFVSDFIRLKVIYEHGGIYLDTDMLVIKNFDDLLTNKTFFGAEDKSFINASIIGSEKKSFFINECIQKYNTINYSDPLIDITIPKVITSLFYDKYKISDFTSIVEVDTIKIYPSSYFYPFPISKKLNQNSIYEYINNQTYSVHLWLGSWLDNQEFVYLRNRYYWLGFKKILFDNNKKINLKYVKKILSCLKESFKNKEN